METLIILKLLLSVYGLAAFLVFVPWIIAYLTID